MSTDCLKLASKHFEALGLLPAIQSEPYPSVIFSLAEGIESELVVLDNKQEQIVFTLITSIDSPSSQQLNVLAMALAPHLVPATIQSLEKQLILEVRLECSPKSMAGLLDEGVVFMRHMVGLVFTAALKLRKGESELVSLLETTINKLQSRKVIS